MRLFKVDDVWPKDIRSRCIYDEHSVHVTQGEEGPGVYMRDIFIPIDEELQAMMEADPSTEPVPLLAARLSPNPSETLRFMRETPSNTSRVKHGRYYGECLVHVNFPRGAHQFFASSFGEKLETGSFGGRVVREFLPIGDAEGIEVVAQSEDEQEVLVHMVAGASFRLHRKEQGHRYTVVISWSGRRLTVRDPAFQEAQKQRPRRQEQEQEEPRSRRRRRRRSPATATLSEACPELKNVVALARHRQGLA